MCIQRRRLYDNQLIITRILVRRICRFYSRMYTAFHFSCRVQFIFLHRQYTILNAIKQCYYRNKKLKNKKILKIMTFTNNDQILQFNFIFEIYFDSQHSEKKHQLVSVERDRRFPLEFRTKNRLFLRPQLSLKSKTITNQQRIGCLVYPEITQISERSLLHRLSNKITKVLAHHTVVSGKN